MERAAKTEQGATVAERAAGEERVGHWATEDLQAGTEAGKVPLPLQSQSRFLPNPVH